VQEQLAEMQDLQQAMLLVPVVQDSHHQLREVQ
jgi:hypothetical protein